MDNINSRPDASFSRPLEGLSPSARAELFNDFASFDFGAAESGSSVNLPELELFDSLPQPDSPQTNQSNQGEPAEASDRPLPDQFSIDSLPENDPEEQIQV